LIAVEVELGFIIALFFLLVFALAYDIKPYACFFVHFLCQPKNY